MSEAPRFDISINYEQYGEGSEGEPWFGERYLEVQAERRSIGDGVAEVIERYKIPFDEHTATPDIIKGIRVLALNYRENDRIKAIAYRDIAKQLEESSASTD